MIRVAAKTIAATPLDLFTEPSILAEAHREFRDRTGGGIGGTRWTPPLLSADFKGMDDPLARRRVRRYVPDGS